MQEKSEQFLNFSERSDQLAEKLGVSLRELAPIVGISQAMLFAYRTGKNTISKKAWSKLEDAESRVEVANKLGLKINRKTGEMEEGSPAQADASTARIVRDLSTTDAWLKTVADIEATITKHTKRMAEAQSEFTQAAANLATLKKSISAVIQLKEKSKQK